jgi:hypothetical protein
VAPSSSATRTLSERVVRYRRDIFGYSKDNLRIIDKRARLIPLVANFAQRHFQKLIGEQLAATGQIRAIVLKARQEGISTWVAARNTRRITLAPNQSVLVVADQKVRGAALFNIYETYHRNLPEAFRPMKRYSGKGTQLWFDSPSGQGGLNSKVNVGTARDVATGRATTIQVLHASEVAWWENAEDVWVGLAQAIPDEPGTEVIIESTANGVGNFFHQMWLDAEAGLNGYVPIFLPWFVHEEYVTPVTEDAEKEITQTIQPWERLAMEDGIEWEGERWRLTINQIAWRRRKIKQEFRGDERAFRQEYPSTSQEAFLVSGNCFFDEDVLRDYEKSATKPVLRANMIRSEDAIAPRRAEFGYVRIWKLPERKGHYVIGADTAEGKQTTTQREQTFTDPDLERGGRDFCSADVFDLTSRTFVAQLHGRMAPEVFAEQLAMLGRYYSCEVGVARSRAPALIGVERNHSSGETTLRFLKDMAYPRLYAHRHINRRTNKSTSMLGWLTSAENRMPMLDELSAGFREGIIAVPNADTIRECYTFVRDDAGRPAAQEGTHDDRVISAALALQMARYSRPPIKRSRVQTPVANTPTGWADYGYGR